MKDEIDAKVNSLAILCMTVPFREYYSHTNTQMFKSLNLRTDYVQDKIVLCPTSEGFTKAMDLAIKYALERDSKK